MADPLSICAVIGLAMAGRSLSMKQENNKTIVEIEQPQQPQQQVPQQFDQNSQMPGQVEDFGFRSREKYEIPNFADIVPNMNVNGAPVSDFRNRPYVSGKMNNLSPVQQELVGPGLGVGPNVPAYGGYQQLYQVRPNNVGAYKLTTLPGRSGPAGDVTGGRRGKVGELTHEAPAKTAFLPSRRPNVEGRAQGQGGALTGVEVRGKYEKSKRTTNRSETTHRADGLGFAPAKKFVSAETVGDNPTRNKGDVNGLVFGHVNNPAPGIHSYAHGYLTSPSALLNKQRPASAGCGYTSSQLAQHGLRPTDRRGKANRKGNAGRMNVRADPLNQGGMVTAVRSDTNKYDGRMNPANGGWTQQYLSHLYQQHNAYKGNENPRATNNFLNTAKNQLATNPLSHTLS
jgi:hypothetical protein